jgi:hypothetical protein
LHSLSTGFEYRLLTLRRAWQIVLLPKVRNTYSGIQRRLVTDVEFHRRPPESTKHQPVSKYNLSTICNQKKNEEMVILEIIVGLD